MNKLLASVLLVGVLATSAAHAQKVSPVATDPVHAVAAERACLDPTADNPSSDCAPAEQAQ